MRKLSELFYESDRRLYLTADRDRVVGEGDPDARFLFAVPGSRIRAEDAERYELVKARRQASNKARRQGANKGG